MWVKWNDIWFRNVNDKIWFGYLNIEFHNSIQTSIYHPICWYIDCLYTVITFTIIRVYCILPWKGKKEGCLIHATFHLVYHFSIYIPSWLLEMQHQSSGPGKRLIKTTVYIRIITAIVSQCRFSYWLSNRKVWHS